MKHLVIAAIALVAGLLLWIAAGLSASAQDQSGQHWTKTGEQRITAPVWLDSLNGQPLVILCPGEVAENGLGINWCAS